MKRFQFQLASALNWRRQRLETERARLEEMVGRRMAVQSKLEQSGQRWEQSRESIVSKAGVTAFDLSALESFRRAVEHEKTRLGNEMAALDRRIEAQRKRVQEADRQCRLLEKLKDRRFDEWRKLAAREEETEASGLYLAKWNRES
jgi:flagellar export protein FliJ